MINHPRRSKKAKAEVAPAPAVAPEESVVSFKGFDQNLSCRGFRFEVGKTYEVTGKIKACENGFHACEHPLDIFQYYPPATSRYALVKQSGDLSRHSEDTKIASAKITIEAELHLPQLIERAVKWVFERANWKDGPVATGPNEGATASGDSGAATASGYSGAATASGDSGAATASGYRGRVRGADGCALFLVYRDPNTDKILHAWAGIAGRDGIEPMTWYSLDECGKPVAQ